MLHYLKILLSFILTIVMDKNDFNFGHHGFKPLRVTVWVVLLLNLGFTFYLLRIIHDNTVLAEKLCPGVFNSG